MRAPARFSVLILLASAPALLSGRLAAQSILDEPFDYLPAGGDLLGNDGGSGFAGPWIASGFNATIHNNYDIALGSLSLEGLGAKGNRIISAPVNSIAGLGRNLATPIGAGETTTVYLSLLLRPEGTLGQGQFNGFFGVYLDGTGNSDLFVGKPGSAPVGRYVLEDRGGSGQVQSGVTPVAGTTVLLVVRAELRPGPDRFTLYANPDPCEPEPATGTVKSNLDLGDITAIVIYSTGAFSLDELRMGSSFADVVRVGAGPCPAREPFEYSPPGADVLGKNGGLGFDGAWIASGFNATIHDKFDIALDSLAFGELEVTGNRLQTASTQAIAGLGRKLIAPIAAGTTTTAYLGFLLRPEGTLGGGAFNGFFGVYIDGTGNSDLFVGKPGSSAGGNYVLEDRGGSKQVQSSAAPVVGKTTFLVVRADLRPGLDRFTLYVDPDPCEVEPEAGTVKSDLDLGDVTALVVYSTGAFSLDEVRWDSSFDRILGLKDLDQDGIPDACEAPAGGAQLPSDCNQDGNLDLSDGVCLLNYLFLGTLARLPCDSGAATDPANVTLLDANGDGGIDLSDATRVFSYLFLGGPPPVRGTACTSIVGCPTGPACTP